MKWKLRVNEVEAFQWPKLEYGADPMALVPDWITEMIDGKTAHFLFNQGQWLLKLEFEDDDDETVFPGQWVIRFMGEDDNFLDIVKGDSFDVLYAPVWGS